MTLANALASSPTQMAIRFYNDMFMQVVTKAGGSYYVLRESREVSNSPYPYGFDETWQIMLVGPTYAAVNSFTNTLQVA